MFLRHTFIGLIAISVATIASIGGAATLDYPTRPVRWVVGFAPGGANDILARMIGQRLSERLGQQFVIENRPGAGGIIAAKAGAAAPPDGYTLTMTGYNPSATEPTKVVIFYVSTVDTPFLDPLHH